MQILPKLSDGCEAVCLPPFSAALHALIFPDMVILNMDACVKVELSLVFVLRER